MSKITLAPNASGTGTLTIAAPNTNADYTLTLPTATGTVNTSGSVNEVPAGSASAPSIYPTGDTNTGMFFPAADTVAISTSSTERMRIDSVGNVGIGVTPFTNTTSFSAGKDPTIANDGSFFGGGLYYDAAWRNTVASQGGWALRNSGGVFTIFTGPANGAVGSAISASERLRIAADGQIGIGGANYGTSGQVLTSGGSGAAPSWASVGTATAGLALGSIGSFAFCQLPGATATEGATIAGSSLRYAGLNTGGFSTGSAPSGTWRLMGSLTGGNDRASVWLRIS